MVKYVINGRLATLNEHDSANRTNKFGGAALKKQMTDMVAWQLRGKPKVAEPCVITFRWRINSKADPDNIRFAAKYVLDGMVKAGVLENDNQKWILGFGGDTFEKILPGDEGVTVEVSVGPGASHTSRR